MAGFLTDNIISQIFAKFSKLHETFARDITVFKISKRNIIISTNPNYNSVYGRTNSGAKSSEEVILSETFKARVYYVDSDTEEIGSSQNKIKLPIGSVKIIVEEDGYNYIKEAVKVKFDENTFSIESDPKPYGFTSNQFYTFYLKPIDEN